MRKQGELRGSAVLRFGACAVDVSRREVRRHDGVVHLTPKAFDLLVLLIGEAPRVVPKPELHQRLWPGTFVSDATLAGLVKEIRRELGDRDPGAPIIRTAHRVGYAFCPGLERGPGGQPVGIEPTRDEPAIVCHWLIVAGRRIALREGENLIGRDPSANVWLDSAGVSRAHARIVVGRDGVSIEDCRSKNGTSIGHDRVTSATALRDGDRLQFGTVSALYRASDAGMSTETRGRSGVQARHAGVHPQEDPSRG
jgi:DNA-binding winged helix-turn-helix (wHTH) protein